MNISRPFKIVLFLLTLWLPLYILGFMLMIFSDAVPSLGAFEALFKVHVATMIIEMVLLVFYIVHVFKARSVAGDKRALWGVAIFCGGPIAQLVYFFVHVWPEQEHWAIDNVVPRL